MDADLISPVLSFAGILVGAIAGLLIAMYQRRKFRQYEKLEESALAVARGARSMLHLYSTVDDAKDLKDEMDSAQFLVRVNNDVLALVGNEEVQRAARLLRHHVYALRQQSEGSGDPRPSYEGTPYERVESAIMMLLHAARKQSGWRGAVVTRFDFGELTVASRRFRAIDSGQHL